MTREIAEQAAEVDMETRFWMAVDRDGLTGLPSDMWIALDLLVRRAAREATLAAHLEFAVKLLSAFPAMNGTAQVEAMRAILIERQGK